MSEQADCEINAEISRWTKRALTAEAEVERWINAHDAKALELDALDKRRVAQIEELQRRLHERGLRVEELERALRACVEWTTNPQAGAEVWTAARAALTPPPVDQARIVLHSTPEHCVMGAPKCECGGGMRTASHLICDGCGACYCPSCRRTVGADGYCDPCAEKAMAPPVDQKADGAPRE